jgi:hypothetical protein
MTAIQCPLCKKEFNVDLDISFKTHGLAIFCGRMTCLGNLEDASALLDFLKGTLHQTPKIHKKELISRLVRDCRIPKQDATHLAEQLLRDGTLYESGQCMLNDG